ncbi:phosphatidate cytidylyltransferase [Novipirellula artificiosorum]|uniref:Phosphatidate cytidylyltransferase n=1 Tax=Novipirellula artificiosorum TaxID=2528016 RepID=A0A5C6DH37_9BACT|nr:phosphatidate cytidylyltransferase [Novipirellula artificiosorum]TWU36170.1 Phosphatidate cytidylyltransferase [Novipirellula artificiosorum]
MLLSPEVRTALLCVFAALSLFSLAAFVVQRMKPEHDLSELQSRIRTWWAIVGFFSLMLYWSATATIVFFAFVSFLALKEFLSMTPTRRADRRVLFYAYLAILGQYYFAAVEWYGMFIMFIPVLMFVWLPTRMLWLGQTDGFLKAAGTLHWALMITVFSLSHAAFLLVLHPGSSPRVIPQFPSSAGEAYPGAGLLVFLVLVTELNDLCQGWWGRSFGKRKIAPTISSGKTDAGLIGGVASTFLIAWLLGPRLTMMDGPRSVMAGLIIAVAGIAGHLCLSALKRDLKIKDFGATLPGHGGVLDRVDSLVFTAPLFFHFVYYTYG